jgi:hypothetical protein
MDHLSITLGAHRQQVAKLDAGDAAGDGAELAAVIGRGVGLGVPHVDVARSAAHPEDDDRFVSLVRG